MLDTAKNPTRPIALDLQDVHKSYGSLAVLKGVSLTAYDGDVDVSVNAFAKEIINDLVAVGFLPNKKN